MSNYNCFCNNCGNKGHIFQQCRSPITSIGIIVVNDMVKPKQYLMIRRKDTLGYVDFMRGKYNYKNKSHLFNIINEMTYTEKQNLLQYSFNELWNKLWGENITSQYKNEKTSAMEKYKLLKSGVVINNEYYTLKRFIAESLYNWKEPEWGFPKGRRNYMESDIKCALREFEEETGCKKTWIQILSNILPYEETFVGSNFKSYKHIYYIAKLITPFNNNNNDFVYENSEVSKVSWKTYVRIRSCFIGF